MSLDLTPAEMLMVSPATAEPVGLPGHKLWTMAAACGVAAANIYYNQPLLGRFADYFHATQTHAGLVATAAQVGYGVGIFFFVPLGDLMERRKLVLLLTAICCALLIVAGFSNSLTMLIILQLLVGITAMGAQVLIPLAIDLTEPDKRGHTVGVLMAGLLAGILLARTVSGLVCDHFGWRAVYFMAAGLMAIMWFILQAELPHRAPSLWMSYGRLMHSMIDLVKQQPRLRTAAIVSGLSFASFQGFWTTLAFLMQSHFHRGAQEAGLFGVIGLAGALAAPLAGKLSDKKGSDFTVNVAVLLTIAAFVFMGAWISISALIIGVLLMDLGVQSVQVAEQANVMALVPEARSRLNTMYMVGRFMGGASGSAIGSILWPKFGWIGVCGANAGFLALAMIVHVAGTSKSQISNPKSEI